MAPKEATGIVETLNRQAVFIIESFDQRAAIEVAVMLRGELGKKPPKAGAQTWAKLKFDRQIVAIAKVSGASEIYSDDKDIEKLGKTGGRSRYPSQRPSSIARALADGIHGRT